MAASKCWFVLRHTHYPPPTIPPNGIGRPTGPLCLGHVIPDLKHLDQVINRHGPLEFPPDMPIYKTKSRNVSYESTSVRGTSISGQVSVPIATAVGVTAKGSANAAFQRSVSNCSEFQSLDTFIVQVSSSYIEDSLEDEEIEKWIQKNSKLGAWSIFMITGIIVARGGNTSSSKSGKTGFGGGPGVDVPGIAGVELDLQMSNEDSISMSSEQISDFVWAVRLAKISKGLLSREWSWDPFGKGATYDLKTQEKELEAEASKILAEEDTGTVELIVGDDELFVLSGDMREVGDGHAD